MAFIQRRVGKNVTTYRVGYREDGKQKFTPPLPTPEGAAEMKRLIETIGPAAAMAVLESRTRHIGAETLAGALKKYLEQLASHATPGTIHDYETMAARTWLPRLGELPVKAVTRDAVIEWIAWQRQQETFKSAQRRASIAAHNDTCKPGEEKTMPAPQRYAVKSIKNAHTILSQVLKWCAERDPKIENVAAGVKMPSDEEQAEQEIFTREEFMTFYEAMEDHYKPFVQFLADTGARINEATALQVRDLALDGPTYAVRIRRAWKKGKQGRYLGAPKSRRSNRTVQIGAGTAEAIKPLVEGKQADDFVFTTPSGTTIKDNIFRARQWARAIKKAEITKRLTPHSLRHTSASWLLMAGASPHVVQHRLGHESLETTSRTYAHLLITAQAPAVATMESMLPAPKQLE